MADRVLLSAKSSNMAACIELAVAHGLGIELMAFSDPDLLDGDWQAAVERTRRLLRPIPGMIAMHGPFMDMAPGSPDRQINRVTAERYRQVIRIAGMLGVETLVFHANFIAAIHSERYRHTWQQNNVDFWGGIGDEALAQGVTLAVENMWEYDPDLIGDVLRAVDHPALRACLDVGHAALYSEIPLEGWLKALGPLLVHSHMNNNDGQQDVHGGFKSPDGVIDYHAVLDRFRSLPAPPTITLEMESVDDMRASLDYFYLPEHPWRRRRA